MPSSLLLHDYCHRETAAASFKYLSKPCQNEVITKLLIFEKAQKIKDEGVVQRGEGTDHERDFIFWKQP